MSATQQHTLSLGAYHSKRTLNLDIYCPSTSATHRAHVNMTTETGLAVYMNVCARNINGAKK